MQDINSSLLVFNQPKTQVVTFDQKSFIQSSETTEEQKNQIPYSFIPSLALHDKMHTTAGKFPSRYLVEKKTTNSEQQLLQFSIFSPTKMILIINATEIHLYHMNKYPLQRSDIIEFRDIQSLSPVIPLNEHQPNGQLESAGDILISTRSRSQLTFGCRERGRLLSELYLMLELYNHSSSNKPLLRSQSEDVYHQLELIDKDQQKSSLTPCKLTVLNYAIELLYAQSSEIDQWQQHRYLVFYFDIS